MSEENNVMDLDSEENIIELEDMDGNKQEFEFLDYLEYKSKNYVVLLPLDDDSTVVILEAKPLDDELEQYIPLESDDLLQEIFAEFKRRNADLYDFD